jgi:hypothetical protein
VRLCVPPPVLVLKNHHDPISAARAFDRAGLCLLRTSTGGEECAELNFPEEDYSGEELPDLTGVCGTITLSFLQVCMHVCMFANPASAAFLKRTTQGKSCQTSQVC